MRIDWERGAIDFKHKSKPVTTMLTPTRMLLGAVMMTAGLILGWMSLLPYIHELGHGIGAVITNGKPTITWDYCEVSWSRRNMAQFFIFAISGSFFGTILWTCIALLLIKKHPELSTFPMAYAIGETFRAVDVSDVVQNDLYKKPVGAIIVFTGMLGCVIFYVIRLTGGLQKWRIQGALFKSRSKSV